VNSAVVPAVVAAFRGMYDVRFPIRQMQPIAAYGGDDNKSMAADNTSAFNCRLAVSDGPPSWSMHAYGEAIDINTLENPYRLNGTVRPPAGATYMDRSNVRPGMIVVGSAPVHAFAAMHWGWGGNWSSSPDYQHFSVNGR
jgi:D-alanyl-D-alanine carboxypeptidase